MPKIITVYTQEELLELTYALAEMLNDVVYVHANINSVMAARAFLNSRKELFDRSISVVEKESFEFKQGYYK